MRYGKPGAKRERDALRRQMLGTGSSVEAIAGEMARRWGFRRRTALRHAHGWSQDELAARFNEVARQRLDGDAGDFRRLGWAPMVGRRIGEYERWPFGGRRPSLYVLMVLAVALSTSADRLLDEDDHRELPETDRAVLAALRRAGAGRVLL